jgi:hypothetical protein
MTQRASAAEAANQVIRYVGSVDVANGTAAIKVARYDHSLVNLQDGQLCFASLRLA